MRKKVAIVGATGYTGAELVRLLEFHPEVEITCVTSARKAGEKLQTECPWLQTDLVLQPFDAQTLAGDFVFLCQEAGFAMEHAGALLEKSKVIDLSADFRIKDVAVYEKYYNRSHQNIALNQEAVYGLPEIVGHEKIRSARLVANPGCYPTASGLALYPLAKAGLIGGVPVVDAKSGVSGAGRSRNETDYLFTEMNGGFKAYGMFGHRHTPEIEVIAGTPVRFTPHLIPAARGIEATCHVPLSRKTTQEELISIFEGAYQDATFVQIVSTPPSTKAVLGTNRCLIHVALDERTGYAVVSSVIDNLVKGASGQAIQNMNLMAGLPEETGLPLNAVWP